MALVLMVMFATSLTAASRTRRHYRAGLADLRAVSSDIRTESRSCLLGRSMGSASRENLHTGTAQNLRVLDSQTLPDHVSGSCVCSAAAAARSCSQAMLNRRCRRSRETCWQPVRRPTTGCW